MASAIRLKIMVIGPTKTGKTAICNHLADLSESLSSEYHPTEGVRILEFERKISVSQEAGSRQNKEATATVELWDCSGDTRYAMVWPHISKDSSGIIYVFCPDSKGQERELDFWANCFNFLKENQSLIFGHRIVNNQQLKTGKIKPATKQLGKVHAVQTSLDYDADGLRAEFDAFLANVLVSYRESKDREENIIAPH